ncbi:hypothetical protein SPBR_04507 [Sporothrix brasiliensis 5110]|uniref:Uncharacterized protein n=1 Tax=Sporothrix brasiliensis 5110 TaxID=1398154 RepID=A0A0C2J2V3_9PEZI|nr:uncharacterized protein SPBR_04507 [Sporothrix brasiliensis 5110]KIH93375.1 hypothetical protein SPBR_04507 [Sporothrix brasiliensis 5110]
MSNLRRMSVDTKRAHVPGLGLFFTAWCVMRGAWRDSWELLPSCGRRTNVASGRASISNPSFVAGVAGAADQGGADVVRADGAAGNRGCIGGGSSSIASAATTARRRALLFIVGGGGVSAPV